MARKEFRRLPLTDGKLKHIHRQTLREIHSNPTINLSQLAKRLKHAPSTISYHTHRLQKGGYLVVETDGCNNFFMLTDRGIGYLRSLPQNLETFDRAHDILFKFPIMRMPKTDFQEGFLVNSSLRGVAEQLTKENPNNVIIQITGSVITVNVREVRGSTPEQCLMVAYIIAEREIIDLIRKNPGLVVGTEIKGSTYMAEVSRQSHAVERDAFAVICDDFCLRFKRDLFEVDKSHGIPEIEFTDPKKGSIHFERYVELVEAVIEGKLDLMQMKKDIEDLKRNNPESVST